MVWKVVGAGLIMGVLATVGALAPLALAVAETLEDPASEVGAGQLLLGVPGGYQPALQLSASVHMQVSGLVATVELEQSFRNATEHWVEGEYMFPLPDNAAVNRLQLLIGDRVIEGEIKEKQAASKIYQQAKSSGRKASLVEQRRPNLFSNKIANIGPGETVSVKLRYVQRVRYDNGEFRLRFPMTLTPRYAPEGTNLAEVWHFQNPQPATQADPIQPIRITAELDMGLPLTSIDAPYHSLALTRARQLYRIALADGTVPMHRDFVLQWRPQSGSEPQAAIFHERVGSEEYALLMILPPEPESLASAPPAALPRELIFVIDTSGSMGGSSITQARASLDYALTQLRPVDTFNIIEFNSKARALFTEAQPANSHFVSQAREFVRHLEAGGGTEMLSALHLALPSVAVLTQQTPDPDYPDATTQARAQTEQETQLEAQGLRQVVFITDGAVANEVGLFREIESRLGSNRLFTVGIGSAPNSWFMRKAAQLGRGQFTFIGDVLEVQQKMQPLFDRLGQTLIADLQVQWPRAVDAYPQKIPDLYPGEPLVVVASANMSLQDRAVVIRGRSGSKPWKRTLLIANRSPGDGGHTGVASVWARWKIESLLDQKILGRDEDAVRAEVLPIALQHQLVSPYTSFVAVEREPSRPAASRLHNKPVPNLRPKGQAPQSYAYPRTATSARLQLIYGLLLMVLACVLFRFSSPRAAWSWR